MSSYFNTYFDALWPLLGEAQDEQSWSFFFEQLDQLANQNAVHNITYSSENTVLRYWLNDKNAPLMGEWLKAFLRRRDGLSLRGVSESWQSYVLSSKGVVRLRVVSTKTLTADQKGMVTERLEATWPKVEIMWDTDAEVIGGIKCYLNDLVLDLSLQGALHRIALAFDTRG